MDEKSFSSEELEYYLRELCTSFSKKMKRVNIPVEIIIVGGASIVLNYGFRQKTTDTDAYLSDIYELNQTIQEIAEKYSLSANWINNDFVKTSSYSPEIRRYSKLYKKYSGIEIRTIKDEYLVAMKLKSFRPYKHDHSDILGILMSCDCITMASVRKAVRDLYGDDNAVDSNAWKLFEQFLNCEDKQAAYYKIIKEERDNASALFLAKELYPNDVKENNSSEFIRQFKKLLDL